MVHPRPTFPTRVLFKRHNHTTCMTDRYMSDHKDRMEHSEVEGLVECGKCKEVKPLSLFVFRSERASNHRRVCLECEKLRVKTNYRKNVEWFKKRDSKVTPQDKTRAQFAQAVKSGKIKRQPCEVCTEPITHGHHNDYQNPLEVTWLCQKHHAEIHRTGTTG